MGEAEISSEFEYSASFLRILIPGIIVTSLAFFLLIYVYPRYISIFKEMITVSVWVILPIGVIFVIVSIIIGLMISVLIIPLAMSLEGYYLEQYQKLFFVSYLKDWLHKGQWKIFVKYWNTFKTAEKGSIEGALAYTNLYNYFSHCLCDPRFNDNELNDELKQCIMPTKLGNVLRSMEIYPEWKYGMDGVFFWTRIQLLMSEENKKSIDKVRAFVDMYIELTWVFFFAAIVYLMVLAYNEKYIFSIVSIVILILFSLSSYHLAVESALDFGYYVRSIFDLYREELWNKIKNIQFNKLDSLPEKERWDNVYLYLWFYNAVQCQKCGKFYESTTEHACDRL